MFKIKERHCTDCGDLLTPEDEDMEENLWSNTSYFCTNHKCPSKRKNFGHFKVENQELLACS